MLKYAVRVFALMLAVQAEDQVIEGSWRMVAFEQCDFDITSKFEIEKFKVSRLLDGFNANVMLPGGLDKSISLTIYVTKYTEAGWSNYTVLKDGCALCFAEKYTPENYMMIKEAMGLDRTAQTFPAGNYNMKEFKFNYCEMPSKGFVGKYQALTILSNAMQQVDSCLIVILEFREEKDNCGDEDEDDDEK